MKRETIYERLIEVFKDVFDCDDIVIDDKTTANDVEGWDSYQHINLIMAVEDEFGIRFEMGEINGMKNVGEMVDIISERAD